MTDERTCGDCDQCSECGMFPVESDFHEEPARVIYEAGQGIGVARSDSWDQLCKDLGVEEETGHDSDGS